MTAEDEIAKALAAAQAYYPEQMERFRDEVLRRAAAELRTRFGPTAPVFAPWAAGWMSAADYIDPDKDS